MKKISHIRIDGCSVKYNINGYNIDPLGTYLFSSNQWQGSSKDTTDIILKSIKDNKIDFDNIKTIYRTPKLSLPREKLNVVNDKYDTKTIRDINKADCIITSDVYIKSLVSSCWQNLVTGQKLLDMLNAYKGRNGFQTIAMENEFIDSIVSEDYYTFTQPTVYYWERKKSNTHEFVDRLDLLSKNSRGYHSYLNPGDEKVYNLLNNNINKVVLDKYVNTIATEDSIIIDTKVYEQLKSMFSSRDQENIVLGMEIIANCNIEESKGFIALLFFNHTQSFREAKSWSHVNFKSIRAKFEKYELSYARHNIHPYDHFVKKLIEEKGLTKFVMDAILDTVYKCVVESSFGLNADAVFDFKRTDLKLKPNFAEKCIDKNLGEVIENETKGVFSDLPF